MDIQRMYIASLKDIKVLGYSDSKFKQENCLKLVCDIHLQVQGLYDSDLDR